MVTLTVNADDLGWGPSRNAGVLQTLESEICDTASIMPTGVGFEAACESVHRLKLAGRVGLHVVLTEGSPLTDAIRRQRRFCDCDGAFLTRRRPLFWLSNSEATALAEEIRAQLSACRSYGLPVCHVDSHHHVHEEWAVASILMTIAREQHIPAIRIARNCGRSTGIAKTVYRRLLNRRLRTAGLARTSFFGSWQDVVFSQDRWRRSPAHVEAMVHPFQDDQGSVRDLMSPYSLAEIHEALCAACGIGDPAPRAPTGEPVSQ